MDHTRIEIDTEAARVAGWTGELLVSLFGFCEHLSICWVGLPWIAVEGLSLLWAVWYPPTRQGLAHSLEKWLQHCRFNFASRTIDPGSQPCLRLVYAIAIGVLGMVLGFPWRHKRAHRLCCPPPRQKHLYALWYWEGLEIVRGARVLLWACRSRDMRRLMLRLHKCEGRRTVECMCGSQMLKFVLNVGETVL